MAKEVTAPLIQAAGAVLWRKIESGDLEIAIVHRPKYDDWSLPKGKVEAGESINLMDIDLTPEDLLIYREAQEGSSAISNRWISIDLDTNLTQELINEGLAREVVNRIQRSRKDLK